MARKLFTIPFICFASFAVAALLSLLLAILANMHIVIILGIIFLTTTNFIMSFSEGQRFMDEGASLHENIKKINWRCMDLKNRRIVLMLITNSAEDAILGIPGILECNHPFMTKIMKFCFSLIAFIRDINA